MASGNHVPDEVVLPDLIIGLQDRPEMRRERRADAGQERRQFTGHRPVDVLQSGQQFIEHRLDRRITGMDRIAGAQQIVFVGGKEFEVMHSAKPLAAPRQISP